LSFRVNIVNIVNIIVKNAVLIIFPSSDKIKSKLD